MYDGVILLTVQDAGCMMVLYNILLTVQDVGCMMVLYIVNSAGCWVDDGVIYC